MFTHKHSKRNLTSVSIALALVFGVAVLPAAGQHTLTASDRAAGDLFGWSVSVDGDVALIGAWGDDDEGPNSGAAYVYRHDGGCWIQVAKLRPTFHAGAVGFGEEVSISGEVAVIGAPMDSGGAGAAYVFEKISVGWSLRRKLTAFDAAVNDGFGSSVAIDGNFVVVGAGADDDRGNASGSAYIFQRNEGGTDNWGLVTKLTASDGAAGDFFGISVSISGYKAVIGSRGSSGARGAAYVFGQDESRNWVQVAKLTAPDGAPGDVFGEAVSISGNVAVIGAWAADDAGAYSGSAYVFENISGAWTLRRKLTASDAEAFDNFGYSVSVSGEVVVVGARNDTLQVCSDTLEACGSDSDCTEGVCTGGSRCHRNEDCPRGGCTSTGMPCSSDME